MQIQVGYELVYECPQPTPMIPVLEHSLQPDSASHTGHLVTDPSIPAPLSRSSATGAPASSLPVAACVDGERRACRHRPFPTPWCPGPATAGAVAPEETLLFLLGALLQTDLLSTTAGSCSAARPPLGPRPDDL